MIHISSEAFPLQILQWYRAAVHLEKGNVWPAGQRTPPPTIIYFIRHYNVTLLQNCSAAAIRAEMEQSALPSLVAHFQEGHIACVTSPCEELR